MYRVDLKDCLNYLKEKDPTFYRVEKIIFQELSPWIHPVRDIGESQLSIILL